MNNKKNKFTLKKDLKLLNTKLSSGSKIVDELILRSWWVALILLLLFALYERSHTRSVAEHQQFAIQLEQLQLEYQQQLTEQSHLTAQLASQSDPAWIELTLIRVLGLVPTGQKKCILQAPRKEETP